MKRSDNLTKQEQDSPWCYSQDGKPPETVSKMALMQGERQAIDSMSEYTGLVIRTLSPRVGESFKDTLLNAATGLASETGEINEIIKKHFFHYHPMDEAMLNHLRKEIGDLMWYIVLTCWALQMEPSTVMAENIAKLKARYPDGFETSRSMHRALGDI